MGRESAGPEIIVLPIENQIEPISMQFAGIVLILGIFSCGRN
jgi:hypothetical protein